jgi:hypothetical protein
MTIAQEQKSVYCERRVSSVSTKPVAAFDALKRRVEGSLWLLCVAVDGDAIAALKKMKSPAGATIIYSHGSVPDGTITDKSHGIDGQFLKPRTIYAGLKDVKYIDRTPIIVSSCFAANGTQAHELSRLTKGVVYAAKAYVTVPSDAHEKYDLSVYTDGYERGEVSGYARFDNGKETPSSLKAVRFNPDTKQWTWVWSDKPSPVGDRIHPRKTSK